MTATKTIKPRFSVAMCMKNSTAKAASSMANDIMRSNICEVVWPEMPRFTIGRGGLELTTLIFGGAPIAGLYAAVDDDVARATLEAAWASDVRCFDTAPHYGVGLSEERIGAFLAGRPRESFTICTSTRPCGGPPSTTTKRRDP